METLHSWLKWVYCETQTFRWLQISAPDREKYLSPMTINCCICGDSITPSERVVHHCHLTGKVFGVAHFSCNLKGRSINYLPIFFHNLSRYDAHHIIKNLTLLSGEKSAISRTDETYISFSVSVTIGFYYTKDHKNATMTINLRFLDSFQFMSQSLESSENIENWWLFVIKEVFFFDTSDSWLEVTHWKRLFSILLFGLILKVWKTFTQLWRRLEKHLDMQNWHLWGRRCPSLQNLHYVWLSQLGRLPWCVFTDWCFNCSWCFW